MYVCMYVFLSVCLSVCLSVLYLIFVALFHASRIQSEPRTQSCPLKGQGLRLIEFDLSTNGMLVAQPRSAILVLRLWMPGELSDLW